MPSWGHFSILCSSYYRSRGLRWEWWRCRPQTPSSLSQESSWTWGTSIWSWCSRTAGGPPTGGRSTWSRPCGALLWTGSVRRPPRWRHRRRRSLRGECLGRWSWWHAEPSGEHVFPRKPGAWQQACRSRSGRFHYCCRTGGGRLKQSAVATARTHYQGPHHQLHTQGPAREEGVSEGVTGRYQQVLSHDREQDAVSHSQEDEEKHLGATSSDRNGGSAQARGAMEDV